MSLYSILKMLCCLQCGRSISIQPTQTICSPAQRMVHCSTGRHLHSQICPLSYKVPNCQLDCKKKIHVSKPSTKCFFFFNHSVTRHGTVNNFSTLNHSIPSLMFHQCVSREQKQQYDLSQCYAISWRKPVHHQRLAERRLQ